jgi:NAD(P)H-dependent flavin oxidoreductase YrpB (nitropropane dioxygenase family)
MPRTRFTELVGCDVPVQLAPMGAICTPELVAAVTSAGAMGMASLPGAPAPAVVAWLEAIAAVTSGPFGFNVLIPFLDREVVDAAASRCRLVDFYHGAIDASLVAQVHEAGALAGWQVGSLDDARAAVDAGCDVVVVRGVEGGGRMHGSRHLWPLLGEVLDAVDVPVIAAGGIATGRGVAAALAAGAGAVRVGTRFVATVESGAHDRYKEAIVDANGADSVLTDVFDVLWPDAVKSSRVLRRSIDAARDAPEVVATMQIGGQDVELPRYAVAPPTAMARGHVEALPMYAGESCGAVTSIEPAADVVRALADGADALLRMATTPTS